MPPKLLPSKGKRRGKGRRDDDEYGGYGGREQKLIKPPDQEKLTESVCTDYQNNPNICTNHITLVIQLMHGKRFLFQQLKEEIQRVLVTTDPTVMRDRVIWDFREKYAHNDNDYYHKYYAMLLKIS